METLLYLGKVNFCWILFYGCYWLLFRKHTFFRWNRAYLLVSLITSFAFPLITFSEPAQLLPEVIYNVSTTAPTLLVSTQVQEKTIPWLEITGLIYLAGTLVMFFRLLRGFYHLGAIIFKSESIKLEDYTIVLLPPSQTTSGSFSFFKWLAVSQEDYEHHLDTILRHESVHIRQWHSIDILLAEFLKALFWFNPVLWFYKTSLQEIHEFLADEQAPNKERYATFLVSYAFNAPVQSLTNHFFNSSLLKSRIKMIYKNRTSRWLLGKYMMIIPVALVLVSLTAAREHLIETEPGLTAQTIRLSDTKDVSQKVNTNNAADLSFTTVKSETEETVNIKGSINNSKGLAVKNATIVVKNGTTGTTSDKDGKFTLANIPVNSQLVVSHVSYKSAEFSVEKTKTDYNIELTPASNLISELVVVGYGTAKKDKTQQDEKTNSDTHKSDFVIVEKQAEFPGGVNEMMKYLARNIKYPTEAGRANVTGTIFISFVVNEYGNVRKPEIIKGLGFGLDDEATRVVWNMPRWSPAIQNGDAVSVQYTIPIKFEIEAPKEDKEKRQGFTNYRTKDNLKLADNKYVPVSDLGKFFNYTSDSENTPADENTPAKAVNYKIVKPVLESPKNSGYVTVSGGYYNGGIQIPKAKVKYLKQ